MNDKIKGILIGVLIGSCMTVGGVFAKTGSEWIEAIYSNIKIYVDGIEIEPQNANGDYVEPFIYNGTTYLPVRAVGQATGKQVSWDAINKIVYLGEKPGDILSLIEACPPYDGEYYNVHKSLDGKYITVAGEKYTDILTLGKGGSYMGEKVRGTALFNLNAQYEFLSFEIGRTDSSPKKDTTLNIYLDGKRYESYEIYAEDLPQRIDIDLNNALQMKMEIVGRGGEYGIINAVIE